ncbi:MAG: hypothetical protein ACFB2W_00985 [Leptolyngbyaceae cyanobacterium]
MPGSKRRHLPEWAPILCQGFDTVAEYFGGALWVAQALVQAELPTVRRVIVAEAATDLRAIYTAWLNQEKTIERKKFRRAVARQLQAWQREGIEAAWPLIKTCYEAHQQNDGPSPRAAAAGLSLRLLTVSGIVRDTPGSGRLNVVPNKSQIKRWSTYTPEWPKAPEQLSVVGDYKHLSLPFDCSNTLAICDPPYCGRLGKPTRRGGHYISPAYFGHRPHEQFTADMAVDSVQHALSHGCRTVIACNYNAEWLDLSYRGMAERYGYSCDLTIRGSLTGLNNNVKPAKRVTPYKDAYWVFQRIGVKAGEPEATAA